jgi:hypothetical protein
MVGDWVAPGELDSEKDAEGKRAQNILVTGALGALGALVVFVFFAGGGAALASATGFGRAGAASAVRFRVVRGATAAPAAAPVAGLK